MKKKPSIVVYEHQILKVGEDGFTQNTFNALKTFFGNRGVPYFSLINNGVKFCEYVGVLQIGDITIEILPKTDELGEKDDWRKMLISMLRAVGVFNIHAPSSSNISLKPNSILELYIELFIHEIELLIHSGLIKRYRRKEGNAYALKGSLDFNKHIQKNMIHQERFFVRYTSYDKEHLLHLVLYKALKLVDRINCTASLKSRIGNLLLDFPEVPDLRITEAVFDRLILDRKTEGYRNSVEIAKLLLLNYHPDVSRGRDHVLALMFDMNLLWEKFVYASLKKEIQKSKIKVAIKDQVSKPFWQAHNGGSYSNLRPDIVINSGESTCIVLDTKWKNLNGRNPSVEDLRQMYVYHEYFSAKKVALIYPGDFDTIKGEYFPTNRDKKYGCSVIGIKVQFNISEWQKAIYDKIYETVTCF